jgi:hypothetical protein
LLEVKWQRSKEEIINGQIGRPYNHLLPEEYEWRVTLNDVAGKTKGYDFYFFSSYFWSAEVFASARASPPLLGGAGVGQRLMHSKTYFTMQ